MMALCAVMAWPTLNMGLWLDELCSLNDVMYPDVQTVVANMWGRMDDLHPPLYYVPLFAFVKLFGVSDLVVRTPPLIFGLLLIPAMYWLGKTVHSRFVGLLAAFFAAISPFANYYDCQSRGYGLAALLTALCLVAYCKLVDSRPGNKTASFIGVALTTAALCYTEYVSCFILPALGIATVWICLAMRRDPEKAAQALPTFIRCGAALTLGFLLFAPWLPSMKIQSGNMNDLTNQAPRYYWPLIFSFNMIMMFPIPLILSIPIYGLSLLGLLYFLFRNRKNYRGLTAELCAVPPAYIAVISTLVVPSSVIGFITVWYIGYFRYIYPYTAAGWCLIAILFYNIFGFAKAEKTADSPEAGDGRKRKTWLAVVLVSMLALNGLYEAWFVSRPQSGLRTVAREALAGKYDNSLILVAPDVIAPTLGYYFPEKERQAHHVKIAGYPRWDDPFPPVLISELPAQWKPEIVQEAAKHIEALPQQGFKYLVIAKDSDKQIAFLSTPSVPRSTRINALLDIVNRKYKKLSEQHYDGLTEDATVTIYELPR